MQELIKSSGLTIKQFSEKYGMPYNSVRQWYNGERQAPEYLKKLIEEIRNLKSKGRQIEIEQKIYLTAEAQCEEGKKYIRYIFANEEKREQWINAYEKAGYKTKKINLIEL